MKSKYLHKANISKSSEDIFHDFIKNIKFYENNHEINYVNIDINSLPEKIELCDLEGNCYYDEKDELIVFDKKTVAEIIKCKIKLKG